MKINKHIRATDWYKNCKKQRKRGAKICRSCPFKWEIEMAEKRLEEK